MDLGDGNYVDGSWELTVLVEDLQLTRRLRVSGVTHVGGLMLRLVEAIDVRMDWSDHGLWWPERNRWLLKTRHSLDQCGLQADARLEFHRMHGYARVQLPDLRDLDLRLSFAQSVFGVVVALCRELGVRHPEELSLQADADIGDSNGGSGSNNGSLLRPKRKQKQQKQQKSPQPQQYSPSNPLVPRPAGSASQSPRSVASLGSLGGSLGDCIDGGGGGLADSPRTALSSSSSSGRRLRRRPPRTPAERAAAGGVESWLDSSRSLMEQGQRPASCQLRLRFKYHAHYDLSPQLDAVRINQLYEQVKWTVLSGDQPCTEEEALALAALQLQAQLGAPSEPPGSPQPQSQSQLQPQLQQDEQLDDEIDAAIANLERSLSGDGCGGGGGGGPSHSEPLQAAPELSAWLKVSSRQQYQPQQLFASLTTLRGSDAKRRYLVLREAQLLVRADETDAAPLATLELAGAEVLPDAAAGRLSIRLLPVAPGSAWWQLRFGGDSSRRQFAEWSAGLGLAARGRTLASRELFAAEVRDTLARLELQRPAAEETSEADGTAPGHAELQLPGEPADYLPWQSALVKRAKPRDLARRILERRAKVRDRGRLEAKLDYVRAWQRLPMSGVAYFSVGYSQELQASQQQPSFSEFRRERQQQQQQREELFGVAFNRIMRLDAQTGEAVATWRYHELDSWTVNWEVLTLSVSLNRPPHHMSLSPCPSSPGLRQALCKTLAEFIGGYVFLSLRKPDKSQQLDEQMFHRLTCSRDASAN